MNPINAAFDTRDILFLSEFVFATLTLNRQRIAILVLVRGQNILERTNAGIVRVVRRLDTSLAFNFFVEKKLNVPYL